MVAALPSTTPRPVHKSSTDNSGLETRDLGHGQSFGKQDSKNAPNAGVQVNSEPIEDLNVSLELNFDTTETQNESKTPKIKSVRSQQKSYECEECGKLFIQNNHMLEHKYTIHKGLKANCKICKVKFRCWKNDYAMVLELFREFKILHQNCASSDVSNHEIIKGQSVLKSAQKFKKDPQEYNLPCNDCGKLFTKENHMLEHLYMKHRGLNAKCKVCNVRFRFWGRDFKLGQQKHNEFKIQHKNC